MPYCRECGAKVAEDALFCWACGREMSEQWFCKECGRQISEEYYKNVKGYCGICKPRIKLIPRKRVIVFDIGGILSIAGGIALLVLTYFELISPFALVRGSFIRFLGGTVMMFIVTGGLLLGINYLTAKGGLALRGRTVFFIICGLGIFSLGFVFFLVMQYTSLFNPISGLILVVVVLIIGGGFFFVGVMYLRVDNPLFRRLTPSF